MDKTSLLTSKVSESWNTYWKGTSETAAFSSDGVSHPEVFDFWLQFFKSIEKKYSTLQMLDIASGNVAVVETALSVFKNELISISSLDVSQAAVAAK